MTSPRWVDADGQECPTRACTTCGSEIPVKRWPVLRTGAIRYYPFEVVRVVAWCGHPREVVLVPTARCVLWRSSRTTGS